MVIQNNGVYYHAAWADDEDGTNFSLTEYDGAVYVGSYYDNSATESTDYTSYTWNVIGEEVVEVDNEVELFEDVDVAEVADTVEDVEEETDDLEAQTILNDANLQATQNTSDEGIGNPNELVGTNQGVSGWTASGATLAETTATIYDVNEDAVNYMTATVTSANAFIYFDAAKLRDVLADDTEDNGFTFSADVNLSNVVNVPVSVCDTDGTNAQIEFESIDNSPVDEDQDNEDTWVYNKSTADAIGEVAVSSQVLLFDLSNLSVGDTISIANLKVEGGALATPWRASLDEVATIANTAYSTAQTANTNASAAYTLAEGTNEHFWYDSSGAHITEDTQEDYIADPSNAGGNTLITSQGLGIRHGTTQLAGFTSDGATIGISDGTESFLTQDYHSINMTDSYGNLYFQVIDFRNRNGKVTNTFTGDGSTTDFVFALTANGTSYTVTLNDVEVTSGITKTQYGFTLDTAPASGDVIVAEFTPYYPSAAKAFSFGNIKSGLIGSYSTREGDQTVASGRASHAEGSKAVASGEASHAEGYSTASGAGAHAEGGAYHSSASVVQVKRCRATGDSAHAEGIDTRASGQASHAGGTYTKASSENQTAIGRYNREDTLDTYAFIVGNGATGSYTNALAVGWGGEIEVYLNSAAASGTDYDLITEITNLGWDSDCLV